MIRLAMRIVHDFVVRAHEVSPQFFAVLEPFPAQRAPELRPNATLVRQVLAQSVFVLVRTAATFRALKPACKQIRKKITLLTRILLG